MERRQDYYTRISVMLDVIDVVLPSRIVSNSCLCEPPKNGSIINTRGAIIQFFLLFAQGLKTTGPEVSA